MNKNLILWIITPLLFTLSRGANCDNNVEKYFSTGFLYSAYSADNKTYSIPLMLSWSYQRFNGSIATSYVKGNNNEAGLGDTTLSLGYTLINTPNINFILKEKFATGNKEKGLGTGENDTSIQFDYFTLLNNQMSFIASAGYIFIGKSTQTGKGQPSKHDNTKKQSAKNSAMQDATYASIGTNYRLTATTGIGLLLDYQQSSDSNLDEELSLSLFLNQSLNSSWSISALIAHDNQHSNSLGLTLTTRF